MSDTVQFEGKVFIQGLHGIPKAYVDRPNRGHEVPGSDKPDFWWWQDGSKPEDNLFITTPAVDHIRKERSQGVQIPSDSKDLATAQPGATTLTSDSARVAVETMKAASEGETAGKPLSPNVPPQLIPHLFKPGNNANPLGRPKKGLGALNEELRGLGYVPLTMEQVKEHYLTMLALPLAELKMVADDNAKPMVARVIAKAILSGKGFDIVERMLDRAIGKPTQRQEVTGADGGSIKVENAETGEALKAVLADFNSRGK